MTIPGEFGDINEAVESEWEDDTTAFERVRETISRAYIPISADSVADTARTSPEVAREHLDALDEEGFVTAATGNGVTAYRRAPRSIVVEQAVDIVYNIPRRVS